MPLIEYRYPINFGGDTLLWVGTPSHQLVFFPSPLLWPEVLNEGHLKLGEGSLNTFGTLHTRFMGMQNFPLLLEDQKSPPPKKCPLEAILPRFSTISGYGPGDCALFWCLCILTSLHEGQVRLRVRLGLGLGKSIRVTCGNRDVRTTPMLIIGSRKFHSNAQNFEKKLQSFQGVSTALYWGKLPWLPPVR